MKSCLTGHVNAVHEGIKPLECLIVWLYGLMNTSYAEAKQCAPEYCKIDGTLCSTEKWLLMVVGLTGL